MAQAVSKNIESSIFQDAHTKRPKSGHMRKQGYKCDHFLRREISGSKKNGTENRTGTETFYISLPGTGTGTGTVKLK